ncbi:amidase [Acetonema longum DSM 6540]|uniref:Amidase n=1 Tax=Acetonema longum DSM 6540 TaxID=1009370 RepID=F7NKJ9_9FIRM|nr:amidase [Acetonema longum DSM 6540]
MSGIDIREWSIQEIHRRFNSRQLTCVELVQAYLERIEKYDQQGPKLNSVISVNPRALEEARELDEAFQRSGLTGPLHGIPSLLKDNVDTADMATTAGSKSLAEMIPAADAFIVRKLRQAGAIILAKANLHEFAIWGETVSSILGQTLNPYDLTRSPGGSSGGTGAGIAANFGTVGIGTDTVNSIRSPASANSLVGLRPTVGLVSRTGIVPYSLTQDTAGPITRTVADAAALLDVLAGHDPADPATAESARYLPHSYRDFLNAGGLAGKRIGILHHLFGQENEHREVNRTIHQTLDTMRRLGVELVDIDEKFDANRLVAEISVHLYDFQDHLNGYLRGLAGGRRVSSLQDIVATGLCHPGIEENLQKALSLSTHDPEYRQRLMWRQALQQRLLDIMASAKLNALVYPHQKCLVAAVGQPQVERNGVLAAITGFPAITLPAGFSRPTADAPLGVPIGIEFLVRPWAEPVLINIASALERAMPVRKPPVGLL